MPKISTESTNSTSLIHCIASVENCEQLHASVLNLIFQQANVAGVRNLSKWRSEICSRCWSAPKFFENWCLAFTYHMWWRVFWYIKEPKIINFCDSAGRQACPHPPEQSCASFPWTSCWWGRSCILPVNSTIFFVHLRSIFFLQLCRM